MIGNRGSRLGLCFALLPLFLALATPPARAQESEPDESGGSRWGASYFPNVPLVTHEGRTVRFFDDLIAGKVVVVNFIYTSCPDSCPLETARLAEVQDILGDRVGDDVFMYSISIDPETDTPEVLAEYREAYGARPGWTFLTGEKEDIVLLRTKLGLYAKGAESERNHNLSLVIGNQPMGRWKKCSPFENPYVLAEQIGNWLHNWKLLRKEKRNYADAPELRRMSKGESLFRTRCAVCHTVGRPLDRLVRVGPDLFDITRRRERAWLERWIAEPDRMLAEGDPLATQLFEAFYRIPMPNMRLTPKDVEDVLDYLETESERIAETEKRSRQGVEKALKRKEGSEACCQKDAEPVLGSKAAETRSSTPLLSRMSLASIASGCVLGLLAFVLRRRT